MNYALLSENWRQARMPHRCIWCGQLIQRGERYRDERSAYDGRIQKHRWHPECHEVAQEELRTSGEEEFTAYDNERPTP